MNFIYIYMYNKNYIILSLYFKLYLTRLLKLAQTPVKVDAKLEIDKSSLT